MRHLDGWQAGLIVLVIAGGAILLAVPRAVVPVHVPEPHIDWVALRAAVATEEWRAVEAETRTLPVDVRAVGKAFRSYNQVVRDQDIERLTTARFAVSAAARTAITESPKVGTAALVMLRAYQTRRFLAELRLWEKTGDASPELLALSGDFTETIARNAWCRADGAPGDLAVSDLILRILFKKRWNDIAGLVGPEFALSPPEERLRHWFLIRHPFRLRADVRHGRANTAAVLERQRLASLELLGKSDPEYPLLLARGIVHYQAGSFARSASAFRSFLTTAPDGRHALRTQNYLKAALDRSHETGGL